VGRQNKSAREHSPPAGGKRCRRKGEEDRKTDGKARQSQPLAHPTTSVQGDSSPPKKKKKKAKKKAGQGQKIDRGKRPVLSKGVDKSFLVLDKKTHQKRDVARRCF